MKKLGLDFTQLSKKVIEMASLEADSYNSTLMKDLSQLQQGLMHVGKRVTRNDQTVRVMAENHGESVRYLREYRDNFRRISSEHALSLNSPPGQECATEQHSSLNASTNLNKHQEITALN